MARRIIGCQQELLFYIPNYRKNMGRNSSSVMQIGHIGKCEFYMPKFLRETVTVHRQAYIIYGNDRLRTEPLAIYTRSSGTNT